MLENLVEIMKPYYDKLKEIKSFYNDESSNVNRNIIKTRIVSLRKRKNKEIEDFINENYLNSSVSPHHIAMIRNDLEKAYQKKENELKKDLESVEENLKLDLIKIKNDITKNLMSNKNQLEIELKECNDRLSSPDLSLSDFKYMYDENGIPLNGESWKKIYDTRDDIYKKIIDIKEKLNIIKTVLESMEHEVQLLEEKIKGNNALNNDNNNDNNPDFDLDNINDKINKEVFGEDLSSAYQAKLYGLNKKRQLLVAESVKDLSLVMCDDIINHVCQDMHAIKLDSDLKKNNSGYYLSEKSKDDTKYKYNQAIGLNEDDLAGNLICEIPSGQYVNLDEINNALDIYYKSSKGQKFAIVDELKNGGKIAVNSKGKEIIEENIGKKHKWLTKFDVRKLKKALKKCSSIMLKNREEKGLTEQQLYIKGAGKQKEMLVTNNLNTNLPNGYYISRDELISELRNLFNKKQNSWFKRLSDNLSEKFGSIKNSLNEPIGIKTQPKNMHDDEDTGKYKIK